MYPEKSLHPAGRDCFHGLKNKLFAYIMKTLFAGVDIHCSDYVQELMKRCLQGMIKRLFAGVGEETVECHKRTDCRA